MNTPGIPQTDSIQELARFWDTNDVTDFEDELDEVTEPVFERESVVEVQLTPEEELLRFRLLKATPFWLAGLRVASVLAVVGAIVAEFSGANAGVGYIVIVSAVRIDTPLLMTGILLSGLCGIVLYWIAAGVEGLVLKKTHLEPLPE